MTAQWIPEMIRRHKAGEPVGVYSVCSAHPTVVAAAIAQAADDSSFVLIEATSNQVDQFGGYTGLRPADFRDLVLGIADEHGFDRDRVVLGGDHLGPNRWQDQPAAAAMANADTLIAAYVEAGYRKIHLDCSMSCADDPVVLSDEVVARRSARLLQVSEAAAHRLGIEPPVYVIGTEVPVPGGAHETLTRLTPTPAERARRTIEAHRAAFDAVGLAHVWPRVIALVVQPGVEFDHLNVIDYERTATTELRRVLDTEANLVFEAHSTDYQKPDRLRELVEDHWAILKVGPWLTFAMREALFALSHIETELVEPPSCANLIEVIERRMLAEPRYWQSYYEGDPVTQRTARRYSYSDRLRYYWADPEVDAARRALLANLRRTGIPAPLVSQYLPAQYDRIRAGELSSDPQSIVIDRVRDALRPYASACRAADHTTALTIGAAR
ncbi:D-tagatose-bisphosphate aldolase, class II, non-catalytic subunit [Mycolicibacterium goodii]|uniref:D-tagatose-bisphosphate aldolase, class II, non-catalytic subunit n=1 Tax=Mycolicibacterium goodii TaxID=134601 RepID=A0ABS6HWX9_MYCGD|nr:D-tagatose-bisphosphate aldolase, class II, non-catalytic subunit [Mycolicibacterium goodii]MBU8817094.1 D-tagatose-bisphosphate aldolase, class II, non-catalytic subunit [Mycolicibacterium goodii]MBU8827070.1 D-tagatose-bisphosphate aldolase, class II, non-catalytic subunit [Mycolicibacterium goodii]MBU8840572.1 D-tagatose-bisphosphate aldolase, class II, non-catalytic subunit [Mycolicibacterium goodii]ULN48299.1 D-tagatose-bisphosphate aldolase, class II, non-catalytic subunit [Mycolicibac